MEYCKLAALLLAVTAAFFDLSTDKIPNWLCFAGFGAGICLRMLLLPAGPWQGLFGALLGAGLPFALLFLPYCFRMVGAGDVKLLMALGAFAGWPGSLNLLFGTLLLGAAFSIGIMCGRTGFLPRLRHFKGFVQGLLAGVPEPYGTIGKRPENMHFAVPVFLGTFLWALFF